jgi:hypothetical protein
VAAIFAVFSLIGIAGESIEIDMDGPDIDTGLGGLFSFGSLPITLVFAMLSGFGWLASLAMEMFLTPLLGAWVSDTILGSILWGGAVLVLAGLVALFATSRAAKLLRPLFIVQTFHTGATIIGQTATVASLSVNKQHGQARFSGFNNNADITLQIVSDEEGLTENDVVSIVDYDDERNVYEVRLAEKHAGSDTALTYDIPAEDITTSIPTATTTKEHL